MGCETFTLISIYYDEETEPDNYLVPDEEIDEEIRGYLKCTYNKGFGSDVDDMCLDDCYALHFIFSLLDRFQCSESAINSLRDYDDDTYEDYKYGHITDSYGDWKDYICPDGPLSNINVSHFYVYSGAMFN